MNTLDIRYMHGKKNKSNTPTAEINFRGISLQRKIEVFLEVTRNFTDLKKRISRGGLQFG